MAFLFCSVFLAVGLVCPGDGFVVLFELAYFLEPVVFAVDGAHVVDDGVQVDFFVVLIFVRHVLNITKKGRFVYERRGRAF